MPPDPFTTALCRAAGADPAWWDADANPDQRTIAAWFCRACPARDACAGTADQLGRAATGTWAGQYRPAPAEPGDDTDAEFIAVFGALWTQTAAVPVHHEPQLLLFELDETGVT